MHKVKKVPKFKNEDQERKFWARADTTEYFDMTKPVDIDLSLLRPSTKVITLRVPEHLLEALKRIANKMDVPYQSLTKTFLMERIEREQRLAS